MKKKLIPILVLIIICINGCGLLKASEKRQQKVNSTLAAEKMVFSNLDKIIEAINGRDEDGIKAVMSEDMLKNGENIESGIAYLFDFAEEEIISYERRGLPSEYRNDANGKKIFSWGIIHVSTSEGEGYYIGLTLTARNDEKTSQEGVNQISIYHNMDEYVDFDYDGIYVPDDYLKAWKEKQAEESEAEDAEMTENSETR